METSPSPDPLMLAPAAVCVLVGPELRIERANDVFEELAGRRGLVGQRLHDAMPELCDQGVERALLEVMRSGQRLTSGEALHELERDGRTIETYWTLTYLPASEPDAPIQRVMIFGQEVTEQVLARQAAQVARREADDLSDRLGLALDAAGLGAWEHSFATGETYWSPRCRAVLGLDGDRPHPDDWKLLAQAMAATSATVQLRNGRWLSVYGRTIYRDRTPVRMIGTIADVTDRMRDEARLREAVAAAEDADRRKDEFLAMLSHELRNLLTPIRVGTQLLRNRLGDFVGTELDILDRQNSNLTRLVDDLLDVSRAIRGKLALRRERVSVRELLERVIANVRPLLDERRHQLEVAVAPGPLEVDGDPVRLEQALVNLASNAAKYTDPGGRITLEAERDGDAIVLSVRDTGIGLAPEQLEAVFGLYHQDPSARDRSRGGLGLGLAIVKGLVELHGGTVRASSAGVGRGSEFEIRLPAPDGLDDAAPAPRHVPPTRLSSEGRGLRILVVDDNQDSAELLAGFLDDLGHACRAVYDGPSALTAAAEFHPDLVLLDIGLPGLDGYAVARRLADDGCAATLIALTGYAQERDRRLAVEAGFAHHLVKPVDLDRLVGLVETLR